MMMNIRDCLLGMEEKERERITLDSVWCDQLLCL